MNGSDDEADEEESDTTEREIDGEREGKDRFLSLARSREKGAMIDAAVVSSRLNSLFVEYETVKWRGVSHRMSVRSFSPLRCVSRSEQREHSGRPFVRADE